MRRLPALFLALLFCLSGCADLPEPYSDSSAQSRSAPSDAPEAAAYEEYSGPTTDEYIEQIVTKAVNKLFEPDMSEYDRVKASFDYLIEIGYYRWTPALDLWRIRSADDSTPDFVHIRGVSFLTHGMGTCEDYASALVLLLEGMDMEAQYLPGLTYSSDGDLVFHAWALAKVDGVWYHLDPQLEDKIADDGTVHYKYFLRSDETMRRSHVWGQRLIDSGRLRADQNEEISELYLGNSCPQDFPTPPPHTMPPTKKPTETAILTSLYRELEEYEITYGKKEYRDFELLPPVFGRYGGYSSNESFLERSEDFILEILTNRLLIPPESGSGYAHSSVAKSFPAGR